MIRPRGRGAFASVMCMLGVPAVLAGVARVVVCMPPGPQGEVDAATLYAAKKIGISEIYRVGGAQAVAAVAFGTETIPRCDKIVGPGNVWVSSARQLLAGRIDPGPPAGPRTPPRSAGSPRARGRRREGGRGPRVLRRPPRPRRAPR